MIHLLITLISVARHIITSKIQLMIFKSGPRLVDVTDIPLGAIVLFLLEALENDTRRWEL